MSLDGGRLSELAALVGEPRLAGRTGGGVSLAVGIAQIFGDLPGAKSLMSYFYHFVIMFEALFVLTTIDTGTRIGRFLVQELLGTRGAAHGEDRLAARQPSSRRPLIVGGWSYFIFTGSIQSLWPMFGVANQLLAVVALTVATSVIVNEGRARYAWVTLAPLVFLGTTTLAGGALSIRDIFLPMTTVGRPGRRLQGLAQLRAHGRDDGVASCSFSSTRFPAGGGTGRRAAPRRKPPSPRLAGGVTRVSRIIGG